MKHTTLIFCALALILTNCAGYRVGNIQGSDMKDVKTIYVPVVKNESYEPNLPVMTTDAIIRAIENDGTYQSTRQQGADATLEVVIKEMQRVPLRQDRSDIQVTQEYQVTLIAQATLTNLRSGKRIFTNKEISGKSKYFVQGNLQESERQVMPMAAEDLARNLNKLITEGW